MVKRLAARDRAVLRVSGADAVDFLQDLVTNDIAKATAERAVYAALLTPQGKFLFDFFVLADDEGLLLDVAAADAPALAQRLNMYKLRRKVEISATDLKVGLVWDGGEDGVADPRDPALGRRTYGPDFVEDTADEAEYEALRVRLAAPKSGVELVRDDTYILEAGFERLHGVDFRKGCFVGQEIVARMKHKAELRKGLRRVSVTGEAPAPGTEILTADGRVAGTLYTVAAGEGLAFLRFDRAEGELSAGAATIRML
jgi:hypothetical protein